MLLETRLGAVAFPNRSLMVKGESRVESLALTNTMTVEK
jgi:hypothetical protein